ncbi:UDP-N-acetylmuramate--L-alanine ligase [Candidatus Uhrbacteria bacterium]|jgi:UDP-N-acetylmuramate--alanine ligase|nr:UDP-N-acetylmuramate--L-alanine ligase [Candidatus Uhrbacteria bacterium]
MMNAKTVHIVGLGGIGTSAIARLFLANGATVSGSDVHSSSIIDDLKNEGIEFRLGHFAENVPRDCDLMIYSRAVPADNVERQIASERSIVELSYPEFLGELAKTKKTIAVSGTNGKSTTTAMIASILIEAGLDPTVIVGTQVPGWERHNLRIGESEWLVVEACEHMASMLNIAPDVAVITNITEDHLDFYSGIDEIVETFQKWVSSIKSGGACVINAQDDESAKIEFSKIEKFEVEGRHIDGENQSFMVDGDPYRLMIPGDFNAQNAAAAIVAAKHVGVSAGVCAQALEKFKGTWRRFEHLGVWKSADIYSDYAHHPDAIKGSISAFKEAKPDRRIVLVFEPHQHSRTKELFDDFTTCFYGVDELILAEIYGVEGRAEDEAISAKVLADSVKGTGSIDDVHFAKDHDNAESILRDVVKPNDVVIIMGAGSIDNLARKLVI